jgi:hypothetical protein
MKVTKNLFVILTASGVLLVSSLAAQDKKDEKPAAPAAPPVRPSGAPDRSAALAKFLGLSDEQRVKVKPILDDEMTQTRALRDDKSLTPQARMAKSREIREATSTKIKPLLNPEQLEKWDKMRPRPAAPGSPAAPAGAPKPKLSTDPAAPAPALPK